MRVLANGDAAKGGGGVEWCCTVWDNKKKGNYSVATVPRGVLT